MNRIRTHDVSDTGAVLHQLIWVRNIPVDGDMQVDMWNITYMFEFDRNFDHAKFQFKINLTLSITKKEKK